MSDSEAFAQIVVSENLHDWHKVYATSTLPNYEYDAAGVEQITFAIRPDARQKFRL